ncbi:MAG: ABC transporter permease, partial [Mesorhizobium sp.]
MAFFLARRLVQAVLILLGVAAITFLLLYFLPADPAVLIAGRSATPHMVAAIRHELGLDQPLVMQFLHYVGNLLHGDLGRSYTQKTEVLPLILARLPATLILMA